MRALDSGDMVSHVESFPRYVAEAREAETPDPGKTDGVAVAGMGGSGIVGELLAALCRDVLDVPVVALHGPSLPRFVGPGYLFISVSYSGNTEETLSAHRGAVERGCRTLAVTSGGRLVKEERDHLCRVPRGLPPRAALPHLLAPLVGIANHLGADLDLRGASRSLGDPRERAYEIATGIGEEVPLVYGYGPLAPAAYRWKCQVNENAKRHAFWNYFPELDHNEAEAWDGEGFAPVVLRTEDGDMEERVDATLEAALPRERVHQATFEGGLSGVLSAVHLGDWVSLYMAGMRGVDPTPVPKIERVKGLLG